jgi:hypothetical protein
VLANTPIRRRHDPRHYAETRSERVQTVPETRQVC